MIKYNKQNIFVFEEMFKTQILIKLNELPNQGNFAPILAKTEMAVEIYKTVKSIKSNPQTDPIKSFYSFIWDGPFVEGCWKFLNKSFSSLDFLAYIILNLSILISILHSVSYYF